MNDFYLSDLLPFTINSYFISFRLFLSCREQGKLLDSDLYPTLSHNHFLYLNTIFKFATEWFLRCYYLIKYVPFPHFRNRIGDFHYSEHNEMILYQVISLWITKRRENYFLIITCLYFLCKSVFMSYHFLYFVCYVVTHSFNKVKCFV